MIDNKKKKEIYSGLPDALKEKISSLENIERVESIAKKFSLNENQKDVLDSEVLLFMMGLQNKDGFVQNISKNIGLDQNRSNELYKEVETVILEEVKNLIPQNIGTGAIEKKVADNNPEHLDVLSKQEETPVPTKPLPNPGPFPEEKTNPMVEERKWWEQPKDTGGTGAYSIPNIDKIKDSVSSNAPETKPQENLQSLQKEITSQVPEIAPEMDLAVQKETPRTDVGQATPRQEATPPKIMGLANEAIQKPPQTPVAPARPQTQPSPSFFEKIVPTTSASSQTQNSNQNSVVDSTLSNLAEDEEEWQKRKNAFVNQGNQDKILKTSYPQGQDPYREPLN